MTRLSDPVLVCNGCGHVHHGPISNTGAHDRACPTHGVTEAGWGKCTHAGNCYREAES